MFAKILLPTDGSPFAAQGVTHGLRLARELRSGVTVVVVTEPSFAASPDEEIRAARGSTADELTVAAVALAARRLEAVREQAVEFGVACETIHVFDRFAADGILDTARDRSSDLIVMASHGLRGVVRMLLGSQAFEVVTRATVPVLVVRVRSQSDANPVATGDRAAPLYSSILIASDGSPLAQKAIDRGLALAKELRASVVFVVASGASSGLRMDGAPTVRMWGSRAEIAQASAKAADAILQRCGQQAAALGIVHGLVHERDKVAADAIIETAQRHHSDLIVMGSHGYRGAERLMLGSQAYDVLGRATSPVLVVR